VNEDFNTYYDWDKYQIKFDLIKKRIFSLKNELGYSNQIVSVLNKMLEVDEYRRVGINELNQVLGSRQVMPQSDKKIRQSFVEYGDFNGRGLMNAAQDPQQQFVKITFKF
jgi:hypothetical protein